MEMLILAFLLFVLVFTFMVYFTSRWISSFLQRHIQGRLDALDQVVNQGAVPVAWLAPYRRKAAKLKARGASKQRIERLSRRAQKHALIKLKELRKYVEGTGVADTPETRDFMVGEIERQAERWGDDTVWQRTVDLTQPAESYESQWKAERDADGRA